MAKTVVFESEKLGLTLVRQCRRQIPIPDGSGWQTVRETIEYRFNPENSPRGLDRRGDPDRAQAAEHGFVGVLRVKEGQHKLATDGEGWLAPGEEVGVERDAVKALMAHRGFGTKFWIAGHAPGTLYPRPEEWRANILQASVALDVDTLTDMIRQERSTHGRADLLAEAELALETVQAARAELEAAQEQAAKKPAAKKAPAAA